MRMRVRDYDDLSNNFFKSLFVFDGKPAHDAQSIHFSVDYGNYRNCKYIPQPYPIYCEELDGFFWIDD